jgi:signal peptidase II
LRVLFITLFVVIIDQVTKLLVKGIRIESLGIDIKGMPYGSSKPLLGNIVRLTFIENPGMAFGIDVGPKMFLTLFTILASFFILFYIYKHRHDGILIRLSLALILAGAVGNLIDRTFYGVIYNYAPLFNGKVVDFMQVEFWDFTILGRTYTTWPIWNIADASVSIGFLIILFFHNRIFKVTEPVTPVDSTQVSPPVDGEYPIEPDKIILEDNSIQSHPEDFSNNTVLNKPVDLNNNKDLNNSLTESFQIEDTTENADPGPGGPVKIKN